MGLLLVTVGAAGVGFTVTIIGVEVSTQPIELTVVTL